MGIFKQKRDEMTGSWRKLRNEELHNLCSSPSIIRMIKSGREGYVACMRRKGMHEEFRRQSQQERDH
jgi:hypothetical protein